MTATHADRLQSWRNRDLIKAQQAERGINENGPHNGRKTSACLREGKPNILGSHYTHSFTCMVYAGPTWRTAWSGPYSPKCCFNRSIALDHCCAARARYWLVSASVSGRTVNWLSRPTRLLVTIPACSMTVRCFLTPWRDRPVPWVSWTIDWDCPSHRRDRSANRVGSPRAANTGAAASTAGTSDLFDIGYQLFGLDIPAFGVVAQNLEPARIWQHLKPALRNGQPCAFGGRF